MIRGRRNDAPLALTSPYVTANLLIGTPFTSLHLTLCIRGSPSNASSTSAADSLDGTEEYRI